MTKNPQSEQTYQVHSETVENIIEIAGTISAAQEQKLQAAGNGTVTGVYVKAGDIVKKGDLIMMLDDTAQRFDIDQQDYLIEQAQINGALRNLEILKKQRLVLQQKLEDRMIRANFDGIVAYLDVAEGAYLEAKDVVGTMIDRSYLKELVEVAETGTRSKSIVFFSGIRGLSGGRLCCFLVRSRFHNRPGCFSSKDRSPH